MGFFQGYNFDTHNMKEFFGGVYEFYCRRQGL